MEYVYSSTTSGENASYLIENANLTVFYSNPSNSSKDIFVTFGNNSLELTNDDWNVTERLESGPTDLCLAYEFAIDTVVAGSVCIFGLVTNIISFWVFSLYERNYATNFLFQCLAVSESVVLVTVFPLYPVSSFAAYTQYIRDYDTVLAYFRVGVFPLASTAQTVTIWLTVLIGYTRFLAIGSLFNPTRPVALRRAKRHVTLLLVFSICYCMPKFFESRVVWKTDVQSAIAVHTPMALTKLYNILYGNVLYTTCILVLPLAILLYFYVRIAAALRYYQNRFPGISSRSLNHAREQNAMRVIIVVIIVFTVCQTPSVFNQIFWNALPSRFRECGGFHFFYRPISNAMVILNSGTTFWIHMYTNTKFRRLLICRWCGHRTHKQVIISWSFSQSNAIEMQPIPQISDEMVTYTAL